MTAAYQKYICFDADFYLSCLYCGDKTKTTAIPLSHSWLISET